MKRGYAPSLMVNIDTLPELLEQLQALPTDSQVEEILERALQASSSVKSGAASASDAHQEIGQFIAANLEEISRMGRMGLLQRLLALPPGAGLRVAAEQWLARSQTARYWLRYLEGPLLSSATPRLTLFKHRSAAILATHPDGQSVASVATSGDAKLHVWGVKDGKDRLKRGVPFEVQSISFDPSGRYLAAGAFTESTVIVWDLKSGRRVKRFDSGHGRAEVDFVPAASDKGPYLLVADGDLCLWDLSGRARERWRIGVPDQARFHPISSFIVAGEHHSCPTEVWALKVDGHTHLGQLDCHRLDDGALVRSVTLEGSFIDNNLEGTLRLAPDGRSIAWVHRLDSEGRGVEVFDLGEGRLVRRIPGQHSAVDFLPDGRLVTGGRDGVVRIGSVLDDTGWVACAAHQDAIVDLCVSASGELITSGRAGDVRLWSLGSPCFVDASSFSPPSKADALVTLPGQDAALIVTKTTLKKCTRTSTGMQSEAIGPRPVDSEFGRDRRFLKPSPDGRYVASVWDSASYSVVRDYAKHRVFTSIIDTQLGALVYTGEVHGAITNSSDCEVPLDFGSPQHLYLGFSSQSKLYEQVGAPLGRITIADGVGSLQRFAAWPEQQWIETLAEVDDSGEICCGFGDGSIVVLAPDGETQRMVLKRTRESIHQLLPLPGRMLAASSADGMLRIWGLDSETCEAELSPHPLPENQRVTSPYVLAYLGQSPNPGVAPDQTSGKEGSTRQVGPRLVAGVMDTVACYRVGTWELLARLDLGGERVLRVVASPESRMVLVVSRAQARGPTTLTIWDGRSLEPVARWANPAGAVAACWLDDTTLLFLSGRERFVTALRLSQSVKTVDMDH